MQVGCEALLRPPRRSGEPSRQDEALSGQRNPCKAVLLPPALISQQDFERIDVTTRLSLSLALSLSLSLTLPLSLSVSLGIKKKH